MKILILICPLVNNYIDEEIVADINAGINEYSDMFAEDVARFRKAVAGEIDTTNAKTSSTESKSNYSAKDYAESVDGGGKNDDVRFAIEQNSKGRYVQAESQVITSDNSADWEKQIIEYVNKQVRKGKDVIIEFDNDESITITGRTAWKLGDRGKFADDDYYLVKGNAAGVIDEIIAVSKYDNTKAPKKQHSNYFAQYGFEYRTAYFRDLDGKYYRLTISIGINHDGKEAYNIGNIKEITFPDNKSVNGSKAIKEKLSLDSTVSQDKADVNTHSMQKSEKDTQIKFSMSKPVEQAKNLIANVQNKGYNESEQYGTMWTLEDNVLNKKEVAAFYEKISEMYNNGYKNFQMSNNGNYIFSINNKLVYFDGYYDKPTITKVITVNSDNENTINYIREELYDGERNGEADLFAEIVKIVYGEEIISISIKENNGGAQNSEYTRGSREYSEDTNSRNREDVRLSATPKKSYAEQFETQDLIRMIADDIGYHEGLIEASRKNKSEFVALAKANDSLTKRLENAKSEMKRTKTPKANDAAVLKHTKSIIDFMQSKIKAQDISDKVSGIYNQFNK